MVNRLVNIQQKNIKPLAMLSFINLHVIFCIKREH